MPRLTFTNLLGSDIVVGNADGNSKSFNIPVAGAVVDLTGLQLESVGPQLDQMKADGWVSWVKAQNPAVSDDLEILSGSPSRMAMFSSGVVAAKSATSVHANLIGSVGRAKLLLTAGSGDTTVQAVTGGAGGNALTITMTGDATPTVRISRVGSDFTILYNTTVSTMGDVTTAINALAGADKLIEVVTANLGTSATVLSAPGSDIAKTNLAGGSDTGNTFPGPFTNPAVARNLRVTMAANWDGGDVTVHGTNKFDAAISETFLAGSGVIRVGSKAFKTVTSATKSLYGTHLTAAASIGTGDTIGIGFDVVDAVGFAYVGTTIEAVTIDPTYDTFIPTTTPSNTTYVVVCNVNP